MLSIISLLEQFFNRELVSTVLGVSLLGIFCQEVFHLYVWLKKVPKVNTGNLKYPNGFKSIVGSLWARNGLKMES